MSILINGMEMPIDGNETIIRIQPDGTVLDQYGHHLAITAIPVPPHDALIDEAELWVEINKIYDRRDAGIITDLTCLQQILSAIRHAPTVIPAESITAEEEKNDK